MRQLFFLSTFSLFLISCGQNDTKQKELELKEKELALKEKELNLREKDSATSPNTPSQTETLFIGPGYYKVINDKAYFFDTPDLQTKKASYILKNDEVEIHKSVGDFGYAVYGYKFISDKKTKGWLLLKDLRRTAPGYFTDTEENNENTVSDAKSFVGKWGEKGDGYIIKYENSEFIIETFFNPNQDDYEYINSHFGALYQGKLINGEIRATNTGFNSPADREIIVKQKDKNYLIINGNVYKKN